MKKATKLGTAVVLSAALLATPAAKAHAAGGAESKKGAKPDAPLVIPDFTQADIADTENDFAKKQMWVTGHIAGKFGDTADKIKYLYDRTSNEKERIISQQKPLHRISGKGNPLSPEGFTEIITGLDRSQEFLQALDVVIGGQDTSAFKKGDNEYIDHLNSGYRYSSFNVLLDSANHNEMEVLKKLKLIVDDFQIGTVMDAEKDGYVKLDQTYIEFQKQKQLAIGYGRVFGKGSASHLLDMARTNFNREWNKVYNGKSMPDNARPSMPAGFDSAVSAINDIYDLMGEVRGYRELGYKTLPPFEIKAPIAQEQGDKTNG